MDTILFINKPQAMTSFDVVFKVKKLLQEKSVGHAGTLDPNATGLLIVLTGKMTKFLPYIDKNQKEYIATLKLGLKTNTGDIWGEVLQEEPVTSDYDEEKIKEVLNSFLGVSTQIPPMVSAIKQNGKKLYELARQNITVERKPRTIEIKEIELLETKPEIKFRAVVSEGTYIRTLCEDIAEKLGTIGTMSSLVRTKIGSISLEQAQTLEGLAHCVENHTAYEIMKDNNTFVEYDKIDDVKNGKVITLDNKEPLVIITHNQEIVAAYEKREDGLYHCKRGLM